jgi:hypothetical protein
MRAGGLAAKIDGFSAIYLAYPRMRRMPVSERRGFLDVPALRSHPVAQCNRCEPIKSYDLAGEDGEDD